MGDVDEEIWSLEREVGELRKKLLQKEKLLFSLKYGKNNKLYNSVDLTTNEICRYSRQILIPQITVDSQKALKKSKVLIVGAGGLGCPSALYLAGAGVGLIVLVDCDTVELSNLHRQVLHSEMDLGVPKVISAASKLERLNSEVKVVPLNMHLNSTTVTKLFTDYKFDVVIDGSDNVATRYLLNDAAVIHKVPLVSGSALQLEGQITVYNYKQGPCYRCIYPKPPPPETVTSCGDGGVLGPVPGLIGVLQALETIKILTNQEGVLAGRLVTFDGADTTFRNVRLRTRDCNCAVCGDHPSITEPIDYEEFCSAKADDKVHNISVLKPEEQISVRELDLCENNLLIDVRPELEFQMCHLPSSINVPYSNIERNVNLDFVKEIIAKSGSKNVYVICRRGNDSQRAIIQFKIKLNEMPVKFVNVKGGLHSYSELVDSSFPVY